VRCSSVKQGIVQAASSAPYNPLTNLISDLGVTNCGQLALGGYHANVCSPLHALMDGTFIVVGLLQVLGAMAVLPAWPRDLAERPNLLIGLPLLGLGGITLLIAGVAPENVAPSAHTVAAKAGLIILNLAMIQIGVSLVRIARVLGVLALIAGVAGFVGTVLVFAAPAGVPLGLAERIAVYPGIAMVVVLGVAMLERGLNAPRRRTSVPPAAA
jgi:hypothetical protein